MSEKPPYLESLEKDIRFFKDAIRETAETIVHDGITQYPVFIFHRTSFFPVGELILDKAEYESEWSVNAASAEDLINEGIISIDKAKFFLAHYKPVKEHMCLFVVPDAETANFIFVPYS